MQNGRQRILRVSLPKTRNCHSAVHAPKRTSLIIVRHLVGVILKGSEGAPVPNFVSDYAMSHVENRTRLSFWLNRIGFRKVSCLPQRIRHTRFQDKFVFVFDEWSLLGGTQRHKQDSS